MTTRKTRHTTRPAAMGIRLSGNRVDTAATVNILRLVFPVRDVRGPYINRDGETVRYYLNTDMPGRSAGGDPTCPWCRLPHTVDNQGGLFTAGMPQGMAWSCRSCRRTFAFWGGGVIESRKVLSVHLERGDWVRVGSDWLAWNGHTFPQPQKVVFRPSGMVPWDGVTPLGGDR